MHILRFVVWRLSTSVSLIDCGSMFIKTVAVAFVLCHATVLAFVPFIDGGKDIPRLYEGYFNEQVAKQAASAVSRAIAAGKTKIEVQFPPVPNVEGTLVFMHWHTNATL
jgi:hypothetical protein